MENRLKKVHISYKQDDKYEYALNAIIRGLEKNDIPYSIDRHDLMYRDNIDDYEMEIGASDMIIMVVTTNYFNSIECMYEMTQIFENGNVRARVIPVVDMEDISRNSAGLAIIKNYWQNEITKKTNQFKINLGRSDVLRSEIDKIEDILDMLDDFWQFICRYSTGSFKKLIENDAALLMNEIKKTLPRFTAHIDDNFVPSEDTKPTISRKVNQNGDKSIYIENNTGSITIN